MVARVTARISSWVRSLPDRCRAGATTPAFWKYKHQLQANCLLKSKQFKTQYNLKSKLIFNPQRENEQIARTWTLYHTYLTAWNHTVYRSCVTRDHPHNYLFVDRNKPYEGRAATAHSCLMSFGCTAVDVPHPRVRGCTKFVVCLRCWSRDIVRLIHSGLGRNDETTKQMLKHKQLEKLASVMMNASLHMQQLEFLSIPLLPQRCVSPCPPLLNAAAPFVFAGRVRIVGLVAFVRRWYGGISCPR